MTEFPEVENMIATLTEAGIEPKGICYNNLTLLYSMMMHSAPLEDILAAANLDRKTHQTAGPDSLGWSSSLQPVDTYK